MRDNQLRHEEEIMRLKEHLSDAQRFVFYSPVTARMRHNFSLFSPKNHQRLVLL